MNYRWHGGDELMQNPPEIFFKKLVYMPPYRVDCIALSTCVFTKHITKLSSLAGYQPWEEILQDSNQYYNYVFLNLASTL